MCEVCKGKLNGRFKCSTCQKDCCSKCKLVCNINNCSKEKIENCSICKVKCDFCGLQNICKRCSKKCTYKNCKNFFCNSCFSYNKHQVRDESTNCSFYNCESCKKPLGCIFTSIYCQKCDKRICSICHKEHKLHLNIK